MTAIAFSDLDRTLIYSAHAAERPIGDAECVEIYDGRPLSYMLTQAVEDVRAMVATDALVPITTRTMAQASRVRGPLAGARLVVCANGGRLLRDGEEDAAWSAAVDQRLAGSGAPLPEVAERIARHVDTVPVRRADDLFCYLVLPDAAAAEAPRSALAEELEPLGWRVSVQGRKLYAVPAGLTKAAAVGVLREELGRPRVVAAGDSLLDADLLQAADEAIRPAHGELHRSGFALPHLTVTAGTGIAAGAEIARHLRRAVLAGT